MTDRDKIAEGLKQAKGKSGLQEQADRQRAGEERDALDDLVARRGGKVKKSA